MRQVFWGLLLGISLCAGVFAKTPMKGAPAPIMSYQNFDTLVIKLSSSDLNTIVFKAGNTVEKVVDLMGGANLYHAERDSLGQVYLTVKSNTPFTLFVTTNGHHHLALRITPSDTAGQTVVFRYGYRKTTIKNELDNKQKSVSVQTRLHQLATHALPASFHAVKTKQTTQRLTHGLRLKPIKTFSNQKVSGVIYALQNTSSSNKNIHVNQLLNKNVLGIRLEKNTVPAHGAIWCYRWEKVNV